MERQLCRELIATFSFSASIVQTYLQAAIIQKLVPITPPPCVYSATPSAPSWAGWPALGQRWMAPECLAVGRGWAVQSRRSWRSSSGESAWRIGRPSGSARSSPPCGPPGRCNLSGPHTTCRGRQHAAVKDTSKKKACFLSLKLSGCLWNVLSGCEGIPGIGKRFLKLPVDLTDLNIASR